jgi:nitrite reductase/ring-hydroxylating ferredoxin subunit
MTTTRAPFLNQPYGAYYHREVPTEDEELTHVGPGTPGGEYLRRFWHPVVFSNELLDLPKSTMVMGEELVLFRDKKGMVGCLELHCSHRGTSLEFGLIEENGIRCCYHGWLFGIDGKILDTPGEPSDSTYKERLCHGAYPTVEAIGMVFIYMGPLDKKPPFPIFDTYQYPGYHLVPRSTDIMSCNWMQMQDNAMDPAHTTFLHSRSSTVQFTEAFLEMPEIDFMETPFGVIYIATRRVGDNVFTRMGEFICPNIGQFPSGRWEKGEKEHSFIPADNTKWRVPIDDTHTLEMTLCRYREGAKYPPMQEIGHQVGRSYETMQREPNDWEAQTSQRPIAVHALEHLGVIDRGTIMFRNLVRKGIRAVQNGEEPQGIFREKGEVIPTYGNDTVKRIPRTGSIEEDKKLLRDTGRKWAESYLKNPASLTGEMEFRDYSV